MLTKTALDDVFIIEPKVFMDERGWFMETFSCKNVPQITCNFIQDMHSYSKRKGTLRGIHFQCPPMEQSKLVRCIRGAFMDIVVDLRLASSTYKQWITVKLSAENKKQVFIPHGFGHAVMTLEDNTEILYKVDNYYSPEHERTIHWSDPDICINWEEFSLSPILSKKDSEAPSLRDLTIW